MGNINFTDFDLLTANNNDFLVGHDSEGTKEIRVRVNSLLSLVQPPTNFLRKTGDTVGGKLFSVQVNPSRFTVDNEFTTKRYVDFTVNRTVTNAVTGQINNALRPINDVVTSTFPISTLNTEIIVAGTRPGYGVRVVNRTNFDPNESLTVDGRASITHAMSFRAGIPLFTNQSDHSHVQWITQSRRSWQMIQNGGRDNDTLASSNQFSENQMFQLVTVGDNMGGVFFSEGPNNTTTELHSVDTTDLITTTQSRSNFPFSAANLKINFNNPTAQVGNQVRPLNLGEQVQLSFRVGFAGIVASTYPGIVTSGPTEITINNETKYQYTFSFTGLDDIHWLPSGQERFALNMFFANLPGLRVIVNRTTIQGTKIGLSGNYMNIPRHVLVHIEDHDAYVGSPIVFSAGENMLGGLVGLADYNGFIKDVLDKDRFIISLGNHFLFPTTAGEKDSVGWQIYVGSTDAVHQYTPATQHFNFRRFRTRNDLKSTTRTGGNRSVSLGNSSETDGYFSYAIGYNSTILKATNGPILTASSVFGGAYSLIQSSYSTAIGGKRLTITRDNQTAFGQYNDPNTDAIVVVGNGTDEQNRSNALELSSEGIIKLPASAFQTVGEDTFLKILGPNNENYGLKLELLS